MKRLAKLSNVFTIFLYVLVDFPESDRSLLFRGGSQFGLHSMHHLMNNSSNDSNTSNGNSMASAAAATAAAAAASNPAEAAKQVCS